MHRHSVTVPAFSRSNEAVVKHHWSGSSLTQAITGRVVLVSAAVVSSNCYLTFLRGQHRWRTGRITRYCCGGRLRPNPSLNHRTPNGGLSWPGLAVRGTFSPARAKPSRRRWPVSSNVRPHIAYSDFLSSCRRSRCPQVACARASCPPQGPPSARKSLVPRRVSCQALPASVVGRARWRAA